MSTTAEDQTPKRGRGRPRRIDRDRIVEAARGLPWETLTMQALADRLGVDRKALNYHVSDREGLLELIAADTLSQSIHALELAPTLGEWQDEARVFATNMRDAYVGLGSLAAYVRLDIAPGLDALRPAEQLLEALLSAGFPGELAGRALATLSQLAFVSAWNKINLEKFGDQQTPEVRRVLESHNQPGFDAIRELVSSDREQLGDDQFEFDLRIVILGLNEALSA